jgi:hypothetical protein
VLISLATDGTSLAGKRKLDPTQVEEIRAALGIDAGAFAVLLVGKDGTVKLSKNTIVPHGRHLRTHRQNADAAARNAAGLSGKVEAMRPLPEIILL